MCMLAVVSNAQNVRMYINDFSITSGEQKEVDLILKNEGVNITAFQLELYVPEGITVSKDDEGYWDVYETDRFPQARRQYLHTLEFAEVQSGHYRLMVYDTNNNVFNGNDGAIVSITFQAASGIAVGNLSASLKDIKVSGKQETEKFYPADETFNIAVTAATAIKSVSAEKAADIFDLMGNKVRSQATSTNGLPAGLYIVNGQKTVVK